MSYKDLAQITQRLTQAMKGARIMARVIEETLLTRSTSVQDTKTRKPAPRRPQSRPHGGRMRHRRLFLCQSSCKFPIDFERRSAHY